MADLKQVRTFIAVEASITLNEDEIGALDALAGYGVDVFVNVFYEKLGKHYLQPHEAGLRSFLESVKNANRISAEARECREFLRRAYEERAIKSRKTWPADE